MTQKLLYVDKNGRYCCSDKALRIGKGCACGYTITLMNTGGLDLLVHPTGETDEASMVSQALPDGTTVLTDAGVYKLDLAALKEALEGTVAPEDPAEQVLIGCCEINCDAIGDIAVCTKLQSILNAIQEIVIEPADFTEVVEKLCKLLEANGPIEAKLCDILVAVGGDGAICAKLAALLTAIGANTAVLVTMNTCLQQIKANTAAITGIETSLGQVGCTRDAEGELNGSVLVCKVSDTTTTPPTDTIKVWWFGYDGTVVEDYTGEYEGCTSLQALEDLLDQILKCPKPVAMQCVQKPVRCIGYDNGRTPGSSTNDGGLRAGFVSFRWGFTLKSWTVNGEEKATGQTVGPFAGWTEQLQGWADVMNAAMGSPASDKCEAAFGFLPAPTWRYTKITCNDPDTSFGPFVLERDDGVCFTIYPILETIGSEKLQRYTTVDCDGVKETIWCDLEGNVVEAPADAECYIDCAVPLGTMIEGLEGPDCVTLGTQRVCNGTTEGEQAIMVTLDCNGVIERIFYTAISWAEGNPEEVENPDKIEWVDCLTGDPIPGLPKTLDDMAIAKDQGALAGADYNSAFCYINGRPNASVPWEWIDNTDPTNQVVIASGSTLGDFINQVEALGYTEFSAGEQHYISPVPANFAGAGSHFFTADGDTASKPSATALSEIEGAPAIEGATGPKCAQAVIDCTPVYCAPTVTYDAVCNSEEQVVDDVTIPAFAPIIRQITQPMESVNGVCTPVGPAASRFFDFLNPANEFTSPVAFEAACDPQTTLCQERCDAKGQRIKVVTITVLTTGQDEAVAFYDSNGQLVVPALPLTVCDPVTQIICGCIRNADGTVAIRNVKEHNLIDSLGTAQQVYYVNGQRIFLLRTQYFDCDCEEKCADQIAKAKYAYAMATVGFPCTTSTIEVDGEVVDLCGEGSTVTAIPSTGDICDTGGVRSDFDGDRCYVDNTTDPADYANELLNHGSFGDKTVNPSAAQATANFCMAVKGTYPALEGTTGPTISIDATWNVGSGIAIAAFDCSTGQDLDIVSGTVSTYDAVGGPGCQVPSTRGPVDAWGGGNNGQSQTTVFDTSGVADLGNVVFYSIVLNPGTAAANADYLTNIAVNGQSPQGEPCDIQSISDLVAALSALLPDCEVELVGETTICITCNGQALGDFTCDDTTVSPAVADLSQDILPSMVALAPKSVAALAGDDSALTALLEEANELAAENLVNNTLTMDCICNPVCPAELVVPLDKEAQTLVLEGNVVANYTAGQAIALMNANGEICGEATVADVENPAVFTEPSEANPDGFTTIQITECELQEGKTPAVIETAKPISKPVKQAVKAVVKQVSIREVKALAVKSVKTVKKEAAVETRR